MNITGLIVRTATSVDDLATNCAGWLDDLQASPAETPLLFTPSAGMQRWLSQRIAAAGGPEGICAGIKFAPLARLSATLSGDAGDDDPWAPQRLVWRILEVVAAHTPGLELLEHHLAATDQRYANAARISELFARYARLRPDLLRGWSADDAAAEVLGVDGWQPVLWRALRTAIPGPDPTQRQRALLDDLASGRIGPDVPGVGVFCPRALTAFDADVLAALAQQRQVVAWVFAGPTETSNPLAIRLGGRGAETARLLNERADEHVSLPQRARPRTLLGTLQTDIDRGERPGRRAALDGTVSVHASHGPDRQAEVLRELLTGLFADDPSLQPREVVVACPDPAAMAPHIEVAFRAGAEGHPASQLRVKVIDSGAAQANQLVGIVREVAQLTASRATAGQLIGLATHPFVARRFGLVDDDAERVAELLTHAAVRWGLDDAHRRDYGLAQVRQGTWQVGMQRLLMGEALSDDELPSAGVIAPVDDVESSDIELVGALAELVSRVWRLARGPQRATALGWVEHLRRMVEQLIDVPFDSAWQLAELWSVLDLLERRSGESPAELGAADALALLEAEFAHRRARRSFGDGSLVVCGLGELAQVPHRVVCLVGLDERSFPRRSIADGDDLLASQPEIGDPDPGRDDRQLLMDAVTAASERLVVIYQGWSSHTREERPAPLGVTEIIEAVAATAGVATDEVTVHEPLQPFSPSLFTGAPRSFDATALRGARALTTPRLPPAGRYDLGVLPPAEPLAALELGQVGSFLGHSAKWFLQQRAHLTLGESDPPSEDLPIELDALQRWAIGDRLLSRLRSGHSVAAAQHAEWLRGDLPPGQLGRRVLEGVTAQAVRVAQDAAAFDDAPHRYHLIDLALDGLRLTGRGATRGDITVAAHFGRPNPRHQASSWLEALALTVTLERPVDALILGGGRRLRLSAPDPDRARSVLSGLATLAVDGRERVLPVPPRVSRLWAECRARNADPLADRSLRKTWDYDRDETWDAVLGAGTKPWEETADGTPWAQRGERSLLGSLAALVWRPIVEADR